MCGCEGGLGGWGGVGVRVCVLVDGCMCMCVQRRKGEKAFGVIEKSAHDNPPPPPPANKQNYGKTN